MEVRANHWMPLYKGPFCESKGYECLLTGVRVDAAGQFLGPGHPKLEDVYTPEELAEAHVSSQRILDSARALDATLFASGVLSTR